MRRAESCGVTMPDMSIAVGGQRSGPTTTTATPHNHSNWPRLPSPIVQRSEEAVMNDPSRVRVSGPLGRYAPGFRAELEARGYAPGSVALQVQLAAELSRWLIGQSLDVND